MQGIGERLREARIRQDIDVAAVEQATKIRVKYLRAMENGEFGLLPGPTFAISFLRTYAQFLGLDAHLLVQEYRTQHLKPDEDELSQQYTSPERERRRMTGGGGLPRPRLGVVAGMVLVALLAALFVLGRTSQEPAPPQGAAPATTEPAPNAAAPEAEQESARRRRQRRSATTVSLRVAPVGSTYLCVLDGGGDVMYAGILDEPRTFRGRRLRVNVGRRSARLTVNGRRVAVEQGPAPVGFDLRPRAAPRMLTGEQRPACA